MMIRNMLRLMLLWAILLVSSAQAVPKGQGFSFAVIGQLAGGSDAGLHDALRQAGHSDFIVVNGLRPRSEACGDGMYQRRKHLLEESGKAVVIALAARDWAECRSESGESAAQERLNHLRGLLFDGDHAARTKKLPLVRQSAAARFRDHPENASWEHHRILFATINLPSNNNHYLSAAGRNYEFEDRLVSNRAWLQRLFSQAKRHKMRAIVLFADANPLVVPMRANNRPEKRDGFAEVRKQLQTLAARFPGRILLVHGQPSSSGIVWRDNLGTLGAGRGRISVTVVPAASNMFRLERSLK